MYTKVLPSLLRQHHSKRIVSSGTPGYLPSSSNNAMYAQNMYQVLLGSTRYRRVYVPKTSSPPTQTAGTQGFHPLNWSPL